MIIGSVGEEMFKDCFLMEVVPMPSPTTNNVATINMISCITTSSLNSYDPWVVPIPLEVESYIATMPLLPTKLNYSMIQSVGKPFDSDPGTLLEEDLYQHSLPNWVEIPSSRHDFLKDMVP